MGDSTNSARLRIATAIAALGVVVTSSGATLMVSAAPAAAAGPKGTVTKVNVCHATSSDTNPYEFITVADASDHYEHADSPDKQWKTDGPGHRAGDAKPDLVDGYEGAVVKSAADCPGAEVGSPVVSPPVVEPPVVEPPVTVPPVTVPPVIVPPVVGPQVVEPPVVGPQVVAPPVVDPPVVETPVVAPPVVDPPVVETPVVAPPVVEPPIAAPPVAKPPVVEPPVSAPPVAGPPAVRPPLVAPPAAAPQPVEVEALTQESPATATASPTVVAAGLSGTPDLGGEQGPALLVAGFVLLGIAATLGLRRPTRARATS